MLTNAKEFTNFKIHTQYSICEGAIKIEDLSNFCKERKIKSLGLCDSYNLCGALEFAEKISKSGTQPIIGTQVNFEIDKIIGKLPIFALTETGYKNLTQLSSKSYLDSDALQDPHCKIEELIKYNQDVIILSGNFNDLFGKLFKFNKLKQIEKYFILLKENFNNRFYLEIQRHGEEEELNYEKFLLLMSSKLDLPIIASQEVFY